jgi:hypothetical protein
MCDTPSDFEHSDKLNSRCDEREILAMMSCEVPFLDQKFAFIGIFKSCHTMTLRQDQL